MAGLQTGGQISLQEVTNYWRARGKPAQGYNLNSYLSTTYYVSPGTSLTFPGSNMHLWLFYGSSPGNEWAGGGDK